MKKTFAVLMMALCAHLTVICQEKLVTAELPTYFVYAKGQRTDGKLKVLFVSSYILRAKNFSSPEKIIELKLDFAAEKDKYKFSEKFYPADYDNAPLGHTEIHDFYGGYLNWHPSDIRYAGLNSDDNTLVAMEKYRRKFIEDKIREGYKVFQYNFTPPTAGNAAYTGYNSKTGSYFTYQFDKLSPLSPLWIPVFKQGDIKRLLAAFDSQSVSGNYKGGGIVIEDRKDNSSNKSNSNKSSSTVKDDAYWENKVAIARMNAEALEAEGDRLYKSGTYFYLQALEKYQEAQKLYPTARVQARIDEINGLVAVAQGIIKGGEAVEKGIETMDPMKKTRATYGVFNYTGLLSTAEKVNGASAPFGGWWGISFSRVFLTAEVRFGYQSMPAMAFSLSKNGQDYPAETIYLQHSFVGMGFSGGINIPTKHFVLYGLYGSNMSMFQMNHKILSDGYTIEEPDIATRFHKWTFGTVINVPKTKIAIGLHYNLNSLKELSGTGGGNEIFHSKFDNRDVYRLNNAIEQEYKFQDAGISFCLKLDKK